MQSISHYLSLCITKSALRRVRRVFFRDQHWVTCSFHCNRRVHDLGVIAVVPESVTGNRQLLLQGNASIASQPAAAARRCIITQPRSLDLHLKSIWFALMCVQRDVFALTIYIQRSGAHYLLLPTATPSVKSRQRLRDRIVIDDDLARMREFFGNKREFATLYS